MPCEPPARLSVQWGNISVYSFRLDSISAASVSLASEGIAAVKNTLPTSFALVAAVLSLHMLWPDRSSRWQGTHALLGAWSSTAKPTEAPRAVHPSCFRTTATRQRRQNHRLINLPNMRSLRRGASYSRKVEKNGKPSPQGCRTGTEALR